MRRLTHAPAIAGGFLVAAEIARIDDDGAIWVASGTCEPERAHVAALALLHGAPQPGDRVLVLVDADAPPTIVSVVLDRIAPARAIEIAARERVVLRCGDARLELDADEGSVRIHGGYVETDAEGVCRIVGAQVRIN